ncbi:MAG: amidoligase family protein [Gammaproteobacteria bacterium]
MNGADGAPRRIGVEIEMNGLPLDALAELVANALDLTVEETGRYERALHGDSAGDWQVEVDFQLLKELGREVRDEDTFADDLRSTAEEALKRLAEPLVPLELVSPPLPMERLSDIRRLIPLLRDAGAKGTSENLTNAFGMQFNPEIPAADSDTLLAYLKAFLCLQDWLFKRADIDVARRATSYVDPFPSEYVRAVVAVDYWPDRDRMIDDYLTANPTRNRALDLMPLFLHLDEQRVRAATDDPLIKARPTFHYRLPNSDIGRPGWGMELAWNDWLEVERLAADRDRLDACCRAYTAFLDQPLQRWLGNWAGRVRRRWLSQ